MSNNDQVQDELQRVANLGVVTKNLEKIRNQPKKKNNIVDSQSAEINQNKTIISTKQEYLKERDVSTLISQIERLEKELGQSKQENELSLKEQNHQISLNLDDSNKHNTSLEEKISELEKLELQKEITEKLLQEKETQIQKLIKELETQKENNKKELDPLKKELSALKKEKENNKKEFDKLKEELDKLKTEKENNKKDSDRLSTEKESGEQELGLLKKKNGENKKELNNSRQDIDVSIAKNSNKELEDNNSLSTQNKLKISEEINVKIIQEQKDLTDKVQKLLDKLDNSIKNDISDLENIKNEISQLNNEIASKGKELEEISAVIKELKNDDIQNQSSQKDVANKIKDNDGLKEQIGNLVDESRNENEGKLDRKTLLRIIDKLEEEYAHQKIGHETQSSEINTIPENLKPENLGTPFDNPDSELEQNNGKETNPEKDLSPTNQNHEPNISQTNSLAKDTIVFGDDKSQKKGINKNETNPDEILQFIREEILGKQNKLFQEILVNEQETDENRTNIKDLSPKEFRDLLQENPKHQEVIQNVLSSNTDIGKKYKKQLEEVESNGYKGVHSKFSDSFKNVDWKTNADTSINSTEIKNDSGEILCNLSETTVKTADISAKLSNGKDVTISSYRQIDFPKNLNPDATGPMHISLAVKDENGNNIPEKSAVYFSAHYDKQGKLEEISSPKPVKFAGQGKDAIGYIEKDGKIYTLPVTRGKYEMMQKEVTKNHGHSVDLTHNVQNIQEPKVTKAIDSYTSISQKPNNISNDKNLTNPDLLSTVKKIRSNLENKETPKTINGVLNKNNIVKSRNSRSSSELSGI